MIIFDRKTLETALKHLSTKTNRTEDYPPRTGNPRRRGQSRLRSCAACGGTGRIEANVTGIVGDFEFVACRECGGTGRAGGSGKGKGARYEPVHPD